MQHIFIIGSKGIPAQYGGFETFVEHLTREKKNPNIQYHISCMRKKENSVIYNDSECFAIKVPLEGALGRMLHMNLVMRYIEKWIQENQKSDVIVYILGCRIGPFIISHSYKLHKKGVYIICNPDGKEWKRGKWGRVTKLFLKYCERCLVEHSDYVICDSRCIEDYIIKKYHKENKTSYIPYGADLEKQYCTDNEYYTYLKQYDIKKNHYYLTVGRFVPENNLFTIICEFMNSSTSKDLVIITNIENNKFYKSLRTTHFELDNRIKFVGTIYDRGLLNRIRQDAFAYIHGHEVGGTNPSLLEAMANTKINLVLNVNYNKEVGRDGVLYWEKKNGSLRKLIDDVDVMDNSFIEQLGIRSRDIIADNYSWSLVNADYEKLFDCINEKSINFSV